MIFSIFVRITWVLSSDESHIYLLPCARQAEDLGGVLLKNGETFAGLGGYRPGKGVDFWQKPNSELFLELYCMNWLGESGETR